MGQETGEAIGRSSVIHFCGRMFPFDLRIIDGLVPRIEKTLEAQGMVGGAGRAF